MAKKPSSFVFVSRSKEVKAAVSKGCRENLTLAVRIWQRSLLKQMSGRRSGKIYRVPGTKKATYQASAPGESPAVRTGRTRASYYIDVPNDHEAFLGSEEDVAMHLERGTKHMAPRPAIEPAFEKVKGQIIRALGGEIKE